MRLGFGGRKKTGIIHLPTISSVPASGTTTSAPPTASAARLVPQTAPTEAKTRKKPIPATVKRLVWNTYIGESNGIGKCWCCEVTEIAQMRFHCGHVVAEKNGGKIEVSNLRPICQNCNSSMKTTNMMDFKRMLNKTK